ncbi:MAG TPA: LysR family transcriptional regulator [Alphaproteobacteria bacterium]|nr:LysR family transcriptional regulator [Alphaproteobacteria bacterium]
MDRLTAMATFVRIAELGSLSAAARADGVPKSSVSKQLAALEGHLGARLLNRTTRGLSLTEVGRAYLERCRVILDVVEEAEALTTSLHAEPRGMLRVNAPVSFGFLHLAPAVPEFIARHSGVEVDLVMNDRRVDLIEEGFDLAVRIGPLADSSMIARRLGAYRMVVCGSPDYLARRGEPAVPEELTTGHACLCYAGDGGDGWRFLTPGGERVVRVRGPLRANNGDALRAAALGGLGLTQLPTFLVADDLANGALVAVLTGYEPDPLPVHALYPPGRHLSGKVRAFVDFLIERLAHGAAADRTSEPRRSSS